jgi:hypothetical protein
MNVRSLVVAAAIAAGCSSLADSASAQCGYGWGFGAWDAGRLYGVLADRVPYYAAFPPVYYSVPVPRTYGYSPFAYPPGTMTPEVELTAAPVSIDNPYCAEPASTAGSATKTEAQPSPDRTTQTVPAGPLVVENPFFTGATPRLASKAAGR